MTNPKQPNTCRTCGGTGTACRKKIAPGVYKACAVLHEDQPCPDCQPDTPAEKDTKSEVSKHSSEDVNKPTESWEERFDEKLEYPNIITSRKLKSFIRTEIARQEKETRLKTLEEAENEVVNAIEEQQKHAMPVDDDEDHGYLMALRDAQFLAENGIRKLKDV